MVVSLDTVADSLLTVNYDTRLLHDTPATL
jgi:hypothetical protein